jgi:hypothetical protein
MTSLTINNVSSPESPMAKRIVSALKGQTYMNLQVHFAPVGGSFDVIVETAYEGASEADLTQMVLGQLCFCLPRELHTRRPV